MGEFVGERWRETEKEKKERDRERRENETDVPKLYPTMNMNSLGFTTLYILYSLCLLYKHTILFMVI